MQVVFDDGTSRRELDVRVNDPSATVTDLARTLDPQGRDRPLLIDDRPVHRDLSLLQEAGLYEGVVVRLAPPGGSTERTSGSATTSPSGPVARELRLVNGVEAGQRYALTEGRLLLGRSEACDVVLNHPSVSRPHARLTISRGGEVTVEDLGSSNGTFLDGIEVTKATPVSDGALLRLGAVDVEVVRVVDRDRPTNFDLRRSVGPSGKVAFNRPPPGRLPPSPDEVEVPPPPRFNPRKTVFPLIAVFTPLAFGAVLFASTGSPQMLMFVLLSPVMAAAGAVDAKVRGRRGVRGEQERFRQDLHTFRVKLSEQGNQERARRRAVFPDPAEIVRRVELPSTALWERRPDHPNFLQFRAGLGDVTWAPPVADSRAQTGMPEELAIVLEKAARLSRAAVPIDLAGGGVLGIVGDRTAALALARSVVCQAAVLHGPADLPIMVLADTTKGEDWDWAKWLPHTREPGGTGRTLSGDPELSTRMVKAQLEAASLPEPHDRPAAGSQTATGPTLLVVVDDESLTAGAGSPTRTLLRGQAGPVAGVVIASADDRLPIMCTIVVHTESGDRLGRAHLRSTRAIDVEEDLVIGGMTENVARACASTLARFEDPELDVVGAALPASVRLLPLLDLEECTPMAVRARWKRANHDRSRLAAPVGVDEAGVFEIDLVGHGPHGLIGGTTGAGKSELLRTIVAGLAASYDPDHLTFVLIDFKGGAAFEQCEALPHTVGMVTDLDEHLAKRALRCLRAEIKYRERMLLDAGISDIAAYGRSRRDNQPLPRLVVIIDEFATLKAALPDFVDALVSVAQRGRSLGVHLLLATQRPQGAINDNIRDNTDLRIALRVHNRGSSDDIVEVPDAAGIARTVPGRAFVRLGPADVVAIQTALSTAVRSDQSIQPVDVAPFVYGPAARSAPAPTTAGSTSSDGGGASDGDDESSDLSMLVATIQEAFAASGISEPRRPWPQPLPETVDLGELIDEVQTTHGERDAVLPFVPLALADDPDAQAQYPVGWVPQDGNLLIYGVRGSGTTTALSSLALSLARLHSPDNLHLYVLDLGARELEPLAGLPHTGALITADDDERRNRLVRMLRSEIDRRRQMGTTAVRALPMVVTLIDGWSTLVPAHDDFVGHTLLEALGQVFADGPEMRIHTVVTADQPNAVSRAVVSLAPQRLVLRQADSGAYGAFDNRPTVIPAMPPGRALNGSTGQLLQLARPAAGVAAEVSRIAAATPAADRPPRPVERLPTKISVTDIGSWAKLGTRPWTVPIGIAEETRESAELVIHQGEHVLIAGPARSGKTSTLLALAAACRLGQPRMTVLAVAGDRSTTAINPLVDDVIAPEAIGDSLASRVADIAGTTLLLVDDVETVDDLDGTLASLSTSDHPDLLVAVAGHADTLRTSYGHWTRALRRSKLGVLLMPNIDFDGELLGGQIPRRTPVPMVPGRGYLICSGVAQLIQAVMFR